MLHNMGVGILFYFDRLDSISFLNKDFRLQKQFFEMLQVFF